MSFFSAILNKLGLGHNDNAAAPAPAPAATPTASTTSSPTTSSPTAASPTAATPAAPAPAAISDVDVVRKLDDLASANAQKLNWKTSIVDLLKLLGLDSSFEARKGLATELACPPDKMNDSAQMNIWLHKTVLQKLAANGGNIPKELL